MRLTIAEEHELILHDAVENQALTNTIVQFGIVRGERGNPVKRNNLCTDPIGDRSAEAGRFDSNNAAGKFRTYEINLLCVFTSLPVIVVWKMGCVGNVHRFGEA